MSNETVSSLLQQSAQALQDAERAKATSEYPRLGKAAYTGLSEALANQAAVESQEPTQPRAANSYEERRAARLDRLRRRAAHLHVEAARADVRSHDIGRNIPFGQPILVGHHSERRHRNAIEKMRRSSEKGRELRQAASDAEHRANAAEANDAISSDDPNAISKLQHKIETLERQREQMKGFNACMRKNDTEGMKALGFSDERIHELLNPRFSGYGKGFASYQLTSVGAEIRRCKQRIKEIEHNQNSERTAVEHVGTWFKAFEDKDENRICFTFDGKPAEEVRKILKSHAFKWSPRRGAWVRLLNANGRFAAKRAIEELAKRAVE